MEPLVAVVPNNEELDTETGDPVAGHVALGQGTASLYVTACGTYAKPMGLLTEGYSMSTPGRVSYPVGRPSPSEIVGDDVIVFTGLCGVRLEIGGALGTYVTRRPLLQRTPRSGDSEDTFTFKTASFDLLESVPLLSMVNLRVRAPERGFERFIERIRKPGYRSEPVIKGKGIPVWAIAAYVLDLGLSFEEVVTDWDGEISRGEVKAAMEYYQAYPEEIEQKRKWNPRR